MGRTIKALPAMSVTYERNKLQKNEMIIKQAKREVGRSGRGVGRSGWGVGHTSSIERALSGWGLDRCPSCLAQGSLSLQVTAALIRLISLMNLVPGGLINKCDLNGQGPDTVQEHSPRFLVAPESPGTSVRRLNPSHSALAQIKAE